MLVKRSNPLLSHPDVYSQALSGVEQAAIQHEVYNAQQWRQHPRTTTSEILAMMAPKAGIRGKALALKPSRHETELQRSQTK
jgi:hypothetical protein